MIFFQRVNWFYTKSCNYL